MALIVPAYAKLNLTLDVVARRPDGYHDIDSVMQSISLHDLLWIERTDCRVFDVVGPPIEGDNLVLKAARELEGATSRQLPFTIRLFKRIPMGAGLGGGSADAAAFLKAANQLYGLKLNATELAEIGERVGRDVPFFLTGGTARATGLGSTLSPLRTLTGWTRFLVICPPIQVSTRTVYEAVDGRFQTGNRTPAVVEALSGTGPHPALPQRGRGTSGGDMSFGNDLEEITRNLYPDYDRAVEHARAIIPKLTMTGTGAALFAAFDDPTAASAAFASVRPLGYPAWLVRPVAAA